VNVAVGPATGSGSGSAPGRQASDLITRIWVVVRSEFCVFP
jgi:hypothetical protein